MSETPCVVATRVAISSVKRFAQGMKRHGVAAGAAFAVSPLVRWDKPIATLRTRAVLKCRKCLGPVTCWPSGAGASQSKIRPHGMFCIPAGRTVFE